MLEVLVTWLSSLRQSCEAAMFAISHCPLYVLHSAETVSFHVTYPGCCRLMLLVLKVTWLCQKLVKQQSLPLVTASFAYPVELRLCRVESHILVAAGWCCRSWRACHLALQFLSMGVGAEVLPSVTAPSVTAPATMPLCHTLLLLQVGVVGMGGLGHLALQILSKAICRGLCCQSQPHQ